MNDTSQRNLGPGITPRDHAAIRDLMVRVYPTAIRLRATIRQAWEGLAALCRWIWQNRAFRWILRQIVLQVLVPLFLAYARAYLGIP